MKFVSALWKASNWLMATLFAMSVAVQYGNPISVPGMVIYGGAGVVCVLAIRGTNLTLLPPIVGVIALSWALTLAPQVIGKVRFTELFIFEEMRIVLGEPQSVLVDVARRMIGLWVVAFWMAVATIVSLQRSANGKEVFIADVERAAVPNHNPANSAR